MSDYTPLVPKRRRGNGWWLYGNPISDRSARMLIGQARRYASRPVGLFFCWCGCGRLVTNWAQECIPRPWWDTPGLPPRRLHERCRYHGHCAYRDDDPYRCPGCHTIPERCTCRDRR
jgi:hypothetical protein